MHKRRVLEVLLDLSLVYIAYSSAYRLRFNRTQFDTAFPYLPPIVADRHRGPDSGAADAWGVSRHVAALRVDGRGHLRQERRTGYCGECRPGRLAQRRPADARRGLRDLAALFLLLLTGSRASFRLMTEFISRRASGRRVVIYASSQDEQFAVHRLATSGDEPRRLLGFSTTATRACEPAWKAIHPRRLRRPARPHRRRAHRRGDHMHQEHQEGRFDELMEHCSVHDVALVKFRYTLERRDEEIRGAPGLVMDRRQFQAGLGRGPPIGLQVSQRVSLRTGSSERNAQGNVGVSALFRSRPLGFGAYL